MHHKTVLYFGMWEARVVCSALCHQPVEINDGLKYAYLSGTRIQGPMPDFLGTYLPVQLGGTSIQTVFQPVNDFPRLLAEGCTRHDVCTAKVQFSFYIVWANVSSARDGRFCTASRVFSAGGNSQSYQTFVVLLEELLVDQNTNFAL